MSSSNRGGSGADSAKNRGAISAQRGLGIIERLHIRRHSRPQAFKPPPGRAVRTGNTRLGHRREKQFELNRLRHTHNSANARSRSRSIAEPPLKPLTPLPVLRLNRTAVCGEHAQRASTACRPSGHQPAPAPRPAQDSARDRPRSVALLSAGGALGGDGKTGWKAAASTSDEYCSRGSSRAGSFASPSSRRKARAAALRSEPCRRPSSIVDLSRRAAPHDADRSGGDSADISPIEQSQSMVRDSLRVRIVYPLCVA